MKIIRIVDVKIVFTEDEVFKLLLEALPERFLGCAFERTSQDNGDTTLTLVPSDK